MRMFPRTLAGFVLSACIVRAVFGDTLVITGVVTSEGNASVIRNALVTAALAGAAGPAAMDSARTDALGRYSIVAVSLASRVTITASAQGFQAAQNTVTISNPSNGIPDTVRANFILRPLVSGADDTTKISGVVADSITHRPLAGAAIIAQGYAGIGGGTISDTVWTDSLGRFFMQLLTANRYYPSLAIEKNGYRTMDRLLPSGSRNIQLDTLFIAKLEAGDSVTYIVSGAVTDSTGAGIRSAIVQVKISNGSLLLYSGKDTTSQLGGYYSVTARRPYYPGVVAIEVHVDKDKYFSKDTAQTLPSSSEGAVINIVLFPTPLSVLHLIVPAVQRLALRPVCFSVNGRLVGGELRSGFASGVVLYKRDGMPAQAVVRFK
jgi:hypothetical protein